MSNVTIRDIAKKAGVSIATVSRVRNNNYPVSEEVEQLVKKTMQELNYRPNANARSLRSKKTSLIALVVADLSNRFLWTPQRTGRSDCKQRLQSDYCKLGDEVAKERKLIDSLLEMRVTEISN